MMKFDELTGRAGQDLREAAAGLDPPNIRDVRTARRRRNGLAAALTTFIGTSAVIGAVILWPTTDGAEPASPPQPTTSTEAATTIPELSSREYLLLDGRIATVTTDPSLTLGAYSFFIDAPDTGGEQNVAVALGEPAEMAATETAEEEASLSDTATLWRGHRAGQPLFLSVDLGDWVVWLNVGNQSNRPSTEALLQLAHQLTGTTEERGVVFEDLGFDFHELQLSGRQDEFVTLRIGTCFNETVPGGEVIQDPRWGPVLRHDQRAAWCMPDGKLEVVVDGSKAFVDRVMATIDIKINEATPTSDGTSADVRWSTSGVGMIDAFFPDNRLLAANDDTVFVADGWGGLGDDRRGLSALSATTGEVIWQRTDLTIPSDGLFIQLLTSDRLVVNGQDRVLAAVDPVTGETVWSFDLPEGYNASGAVASGEVMYVGAHATNESNIDPPIAYAINLSDGSVIWESPLAEGTDLQPVAPALSNGSVLFSTTLSHPGSADGNMIYAVSTADGSILWGLNLGGEQGFKFFPTLIRDEIAIVSGPSGMLGVSMDDGSTLWSVPGAQPLVQTNDGRALGWVEEGIAEFAWEAGQATILAEVDWAQGVYRPNGGLLVNDQLVISDGRNLHSYSVRDGQLLWTWPAPGVIVDSPVSVGEAIAVPIGDQNAEPAHQRLVIVITAP